MIFYFWAWFLVLKLQHICRNYVSLFFSTSGVIYHQESRNCELVIFCRDLKKVVNFVFLKLLHIQNCCRYQHFLTYSGHINALGITYQRANLLWQFFVLIAKLPGNVLKTTGLSFRDSRMRVMEKPLDMKKMFQTQSYYISLSHDKCLKWFSWSWPSTKNRFSQKTLWATIMSRNDETHFFGCDQPKSSLN